jgi:pimeloyl-ACP methyl ester carboxylesterase
MKSLHIEVSDGTHTIHTHYTDQGQGEPVVILHGGLESGANWEEHASALAASRRVLRPDRRGHGRTADVDGPYRYEAMARETMSFLERVVGGPAHLVGYSDGGTCALLTALARPELIRSMVVIGTHYHHEGILPPMRERFRHPEPQSPRLAEMRQAHAALSPHGAAGWDTMYRKVCEMALAGPNHRAEDFARVATPTLVVAADDDVVDLRHTLDLHAALPDGRLAVVPHTSHALPYEAPDRLLDLVRRFLDGDEPERVMPMRSKKRPGD